MTHQSPLRFERTPIDAGRQIAQLRHVLELVEQMAGGSGSPYGAENALDEIARIGAAYDEASPIVRRRFDALAEETAAWSAAGVEALLAASGERRPRAAARRLAEELTRALREMTAMFGF